MELLYELNQCNLNLPVVSHYLHDFPRYKWDRNTMDFQVFRFETTQHSSFSLWGWRSPILDQRSLGSLGHIAIYSLYPHVYPKYKKKTSMWKNPPCFHVTIFRGFPWLKSTPVAREVRTPGGPWLVAFEDFCNAARMEPALRLGLRRSEGMQIGVISLGIGPLVGRFREDFRDFIGDFDEMIEMKFCIKL